MTRIDATIPSLDILCAETAAGPVSLVVFGASGDLAHRKLYPSLYHLYRRDLIPEGFYVLGCGRSTFSDEQFRDTVELSLKNGTGDYSDDYRDFLSHFFMVSGNYDAGEFYIRIRDKLSELDEQFNNNGCRIFYLSLPPHLYPVVTEKMMETQLACPAATGRMQTVRLIVEKPFGSSLADAKILNDKLHRCFDESQIYRIDHYLGKETIQNLMVFRFANSIFEPLWNRNFIDHIQITIAEKVGVEHRAGYYDKSGALRDMVQNHLLQMVALVGMEPPAAFDAECVRDEKAKLLRCIRPVQDIQDIEANFYAGQYGPGAIDGNPVCGYLDEPSVGSDSRTETFVAARLTIDNWRWKDVPFYIRTGKRLNRKLTEIVIVFKPVAHSMFASVGIDTFPVNKLRFQIQPDEGLYLNLQAKRPGSKICMSELELAMDYRKVFGAAMPEAYQRLLLDCMIGDPMLFARQDSVLLSWQFVQPVLDYWFTTKKYPTIYPSGIGIDAINGPTFHT